MDYDDNDFQGQNLHLAGEGSSKVSPVLHPYALPKFEFDDSLQGHLRFDSLVESEVFLGITSQEDNQWIEEYSRGSSGIEFSSSAAESRRNNVWSEATSSESVEMLLKSVGQEERVVGETIQTTDASDEPRLLTEIMDPKLEQDVKEAHVTHTQDASAAGEYEQCHDKLTLQSQEALISVGELDSIVTSGKHSLLVSEERICENCDDVNQMEAENLVDESLYKNLQDPSVSKVEFGNLDSSEKVDASIEELTGRESLPLVSENPGLSEKADANIEELKGRESLQLGSENSDGLPINDPSTMAEDNYRSNAIGMSDSIDGGSLVVETGTYIMEKSVSVISKVESVERPPVEVSIPVNEDISLLPDGCNAPLCSAEPCQDSQCAVTASPTCSQVNQELKISMHEELPASPSAGNVEMPCDTQSGIHGAPESNVSYLSNITHVQSHLVELTESDQGSGCQQVASDALMVSADNSPPETGGESSILNVDTNLKTACSSAELQVPNEDVMAGNSNGSKAHTADSDVDGRNLPAELSGSMQVDHDIQLSEPGMEQDVTFIEEGDARLPSESTDAAVELVGGLEGEKNVESSTSAEGSKSHITVAQNLGSDMMARVEHVLATESDKILSPDTSDGAQLFPKSVTAADIVTDDQPKSPILGVSLLHLDSEEKAEESYNREEISLNETPEVGIVIKRVSDQSSSVVEKDAVLDHDGKDVHETDSTCSPLVENCNASAREQAAEANTATQESFKAVEMSALPCHSSTNEGDNGEAGGPLVTKESITEGSHIVESLNLPVNKSNDHQASGDVTCPPQCDANRMVQDGGSSASLDKPQLFPPSGTSSSGFSSSAKDKEEVVKGEMFENATLSKVTGEMRENLQSVSSNSTGKEDKSFTFEVSTGAGLCKTDKGWQPFPVNQACDSSMIMEGSSINPCSSQVDPKKSQEASLVQTPSGTTPQVGAKGNSDRKTRRKSVAKESTKKSNRQKETTPSHSVRVEKTAMATTPLATGQVIQFEELKPDDKAERSIAKPSGAVSVPTLKLPDLNNSMSTFQQPFTDNQQVQLRAQILVYGSLISGTPPDEAHMIAAFGQSDGGRRTWDAAWRACLDRVHVQKALSKNPDTPMQPRSELKDVGNRAPDQGIKHGSQSKVHSSPISGGSNKGTASPVVTPMIPLSSPLWSISTPSCDSLQSSSMPRSTLLDYHQALSPLHPYQTPPVQNFGGLNPSWLSQGPFPGQWVASTPITAFNVGARLSALPITEAVKLTPVKESGAPGIKHTSVPVVHSAGPGTASVSDVQKTTVSSGQISSDLKSRKRKKVTATVAASPASIPSQPQLAAVSTAVFQLPQAPRTEGHSQMPLITQNKPESVTAPIVSGVLPTSVDVSTLASVTSRSGSAKFVASVSPASTHDLHPRSGDQMEKFVISEETLSKVEESKLQAEEAAVHAAAAVSHCHEVWSKLGEKKNCGLVSADEAKLVSSAVSIPAAAAIAKAAAAAAKLASNVAEQARLMADEVFLSRTDNFDQSSMISLPTVVNKFDKATPASILKGGERSNRPISIISAAKEAARRRVEAASAASKHAENLDAIVKAAELAAEAVSQAGKIVAMGDPLPLSELVEAGPEGYWKTLNNSSDRKSGSAPNLSDKEIPPSKIGLSLQEKLGHFSENQKMEVDVISSLVTSHEKDTGAPRPHKNPDLSKTIGVIPESEVGSVNTTIVCQDIAKSTSGTEKVDSIKEGCLVEVYKDDGKYKGAWLAANVLSLKDGKAFVCYAEIQSDDGSGQLKEWVPLEITGSQVPKVRIAHPMTTMRSEGTRKRRRTAVTDYSWSVGDRVDVWVQDCWREGVVAGTNKIDLTSLTVQFQAQGEASVVRSWHVRPTLTWEDGQWIEWSALKGGHSSQGDAKRLKLGSPPVDGNRKDKSSENVDLAKLGIHEAPGALPLSAQDSLFNVGKGTRGENKHDAQRTMRSGLQKEGPRVIFGVPKPGKKQKFMDVSKHYVAEGSTKNNAANDSVKFARYLGPQAQGPRGWRNGSRSDSKEKQPTENKSKVLKSRKPPVPSIRSLVQKDNNLTSSKSTAHDAIMIDKARGSVSDDEKLSGHENQTENQTGSSSKSNTEDASEGPASGSSLALPSDVRRPVSTTNVKPERLNRGKLAPGGGKATKAEVADRSIPDVVEPRRSNRRIQPTSRLLEGLQSSLTISKMPSASHGAQRTQSKLSSKGNNHG